MAGIKLHHREARNAVVVVLDETAPYPVPWTCPMCGIVHFHKAYHLAVDGGGDVVVESKLMERLRTLDAFGPSQGWQLISEVRHPEKQVVVIGGQPLRFNVVSHEVASVS